MTVAARLRHLLAVLLMLGVGSVPLGPTAAVSGSGMASAMAAMEPMADGIPCCPSDAPAMPDCQKSCPLLATCTTTCAPAAPVAQMTGANRIVTLALARPGDDAARGGPSSAPPARPPRS